MMRLVEKGLMFGNLIEVSSKALVGRYNRALKHLTDRETTLTEFHIDISGYSPEIGHEFGDDLYLNPNGCNQQFILLTTEQKSAPLLMSKFSTSRQILKDFIEENEDQLFALTAREAVTGELMNSVFAVTEPRDLLNINQIQIEADTVGERVAGAKTLQAKIDRFMTEDDAWWDDLLIAEMIGLAKATGNIQRNPISLKPRTYEQGNYFTSHFGGMYVFRDIKEPTLIARKRVDGLDNLPLDNVLTFADRSDVAKFLYEHGLIDLVISKRSESSAEIIRQKLDFIAIGVAAAEGENVTQVTRQDIKKFERKFADVFPAEFRGLLAIWRWAKMGGGYPRLEPEHPAYFYAFRSTQNPDRDLVNMLLAELSPLDFRQLFICHKEAFYETYRTWPDSKREFVANFLAEDYAIDKAGAREILFGSEVEARVKSGKSGAGRKGRTAFTVDPMAQPVRVKWRTK